MLLLSGSTHRPNQKLLNKGTFAYINVYVSMMLNDYETFANFVKHFFRKKLNSAHFVLKRNILQSLEKENNLSCIFFGSRVNYKGSKL